jgi:hypothetical protein
MALAAVVLGVFNTVLLLGTLWVVTNLRDDQLIIRTWIGKALREKRGEVTRPTLAEWLREHPDRPYRDDPPAGRAK